MKPRRAYLFLILLLFCHPPACHGTEIYARQTGKNCSFCHVDPGGGGELTTAGREFAATLATGRAETGATATSSAMLHEVVRFIAGYLHLLTGILWFGTILYVHLVLKPGYASGGLPRGEVRVGVLSMLVMGVTGGILTAYRVSSIDMLLHTRFGILLLVKVSLYLVMVLSALYVVTVIGPKLKAKKRGDGAALPAGGEMTAEQLASCDGKEGRPVFFAFEGKVYDVSASSLWKHGVHMARHHAGMDLTDALKLAPHGPDKVAQMPEVGKLVAEAARQAPLHERVFFFMAYMNLTIVFLVVLIVALWRWA